LHKFATLDKVVGVVIFDIEAADFLELFFNPV
jgi:hypothetical protein